MSRPLRICYPGAWYHIIDRCRNKKRLFKTNSDREHFLGLCAQISEVYSAQIHAYCLLDQSIHLLIRTPQANISDCMRHLLSQYTRYFNRQYRCDGALFSGRYKSILIEADEHILQVSRYIHRLPREKNIARAIAHYNWSSYPAYIGEHKAKIWLQRQTILDFLAQRNAMAMYRIYVETGQDPELEKFYRKRKLSPVLGSSHFKKQAVDTRAIDTVEVPQAKLLIEKPSIDKIISAVSEEFSVSAESIRTSKKGRGQINRARSVALSLCRTLGGHPLKDIAKAFGMNHYSAVSVAIRRLNQSMKTDPATSRNLDTLKNKLAA